RQNATQALGNYQLVASAYDRAAAAAKISQPRIQHAIARSQQQLYVDLLEFDAIDYLTEVELPTEEEVQAHIKEFAEFAPGGEPTDRNPHAIGYQLPNRVKLQVIEVPVDPVRQRVIAQKDEFDWKRDAFQYYEKNQDKYRATSSTSTQPTTQPSDSQFGPVELGLGGGTTTA